jgi:hypothetical protein
VSELVNVVLLGLLADPWEVVIVKCRRIGQNCIYIYTVYDRISGDFPAKSTVYTPYIPINVWFWPTLRTYIHRI